MKRKIDLVYGGGSVGLMGLISRRVSEGGCHVLGLVSRLSSTFFRCNFKSPFKKSFFLKCRIIPQALMPIEVWFFITLHLLNYLKSLRFSSISLADIW